MTISGTREWSVASQNCWLGCEHRCRYCYARANALRFKQIEKAEEWGTTYNRPAKDVSLAAIAKKRHGGPVMFPTTHDITPGNAQLCLPVLRDLLDQNEVLIVSKPHASVIEEICDRVGDWHGPRIRERIMFRFTIGAMDAETLAYWEPGAPPPAERLYCLAHAFYHGFRTSVSCEPLLTEDYWRLIDAVDPYVTDSIWIGKLNKLRERVVPGTSAKKIREIERLQWDKVVQYIYDDLRDHSKIRWKESYKKVLGLDRPTEPGLDV